MHTLTVCLYKYTFDIQYTHISTHVLRSISRDTGKGGAERASPPLPFSKEDRGGAKVPLDKKNTIICEKYGGIMIKKYELLVKLTY